MPLRRLLLMLLAVIVAAGLTVWAFGADLRAGAYVVLPTLALLVLIWQRKE